MILNILITGANGFVGRPLCRYLTQQGHKVTALVRKSVADLSIEQQVVVPNFLEYKDYPKILKGIDVIIHTAGLAHVSGPPEHEYYKINTEITEKLALEAIKAKVGRFVYLSSTHVHVPSKSSSILRTNSPFGPTTAYGKSKLKAEELLRQMKSLDVVIIRPPLVYGPNAAGNIRLLVKAIQKGIPFPFGGVHNKRSMIYIDNLLDAISEAALHPKAKGQTYFVSDDQPLSIQDLIKGLGEGLGKKTILFPFPQFLLWLPLKLIGRQEMLDKITGSLELDTTHIRETLGWKPPVSVKQGLSKTAKGFAN